MKTSMQIYSVRDMMSGDLVGMLQTLKDAGYDGIELIDLGGDSLDRTINAMSNVGLEIFSVHADLNRILQLDEEQLVRFSELGCRVMPICWLPEERIAGGSLYGQTLEIIKKYSELAKKYGIRLVYHNHDFDLEMLNGKRKLDILYSDLDADTLGAELDTCWLYSAGANPLDYMIKYSGRCPVLHVKDCVAEGGRAGFMPVGSGVINFDEIIKIAPQCGVEWLCVEQDEPTPGKTSLECACESIKYIKNCMRRYGL